MELLLRKPGQSEVLSTNYSSSLSPQVPVRHDAFALLGGGVSLVQGYSEWTGPARRPRQPPRSTRSRTRGPALNSTSSRRRLRHPRRPRPPDSRRRLRPRRPRPLRPRRPRRHRLPTQTRYQCELVGLRGCNQSDRSRDGFRDGRQRLLDRPDGDRLIGGHDATRPSGWASTATEFDRRANRHRRRTWSTGPRLPGLVGDVLDREGAARAGHLRHDDQAGRFDHRLGPVHQHRAPTRATSSCRSPTTAGRTILSAPTRAPPQTQSPAPQRSSAEWIVEAPTVGGNIAKLANFGSVTFTSASATINGVTGPINDSSWQSQAINIASSRGSLEDTTSVLTDSGTSFVVTYDSTSGASDSGGSGSDSRNAALKATLLSSGAAVRQPVVPPPQVVVLGVTPAPSTSHSHSGSPAARSGVESPVTSQRPVCDGRRAVVPQHNRPTHLHPTTEPCSA